jgi:hypothetical protein
MKKLIVSILMITGLSLSSQVNTIQNVKPTIIVNPLPISPNSPVGIINCDRGAIHEVGGCMMLILYCSNGVDYTIIACPDKTMIFSKVIQSNNTNPVKLKFDITAGVFDASKAPDGDQLSKITNIQKIKSSVFSTPIDYTIETTEYIFQFKAGNYEIKNNTLTVDSYLKN